MSGGRFLAYELTVHPMMGYVKEPPDSGGFFLSENIDKKSWILYYTIVKR